MAILLEDIIKRLTPAQRARVEARARALMEEEWTRHDPMRAAARRNRRRQRQHTPESKK
jgi:hypothetical protein